MLTTQLSAEWSLWIAVNGLPALIAALGLLLSPTFARSFGWDIKPRSATIGLGIGFLMRTVMYVQLGLAVWFGNYLAMRWLHWGNIVFAGVLLLTTLVWGELFRWKRWLAWIWLFLYLEEPVWMLTLLPQSEALIATQTWDPLSVANPINPTLQAVLFAEAALMLIVGLALLFNRAPIFSNTVDAVSLRVLAGWPLAYAVWAPTLALSHSFAHARGGIVVNMVWLAAWVIGMWVWRKHFNLKSHSTAVWFATCLVLLLLLLIGYALQPS
jgi:hypothetical protein